MTARPRNPTDPDASDLVTTAELARQWRMSVRTLERWRDAGTGPAWLRLGGRLYYRKTDIAAFEADQRQTGP